MLFKARSRLFDTSQLLMVQDSRSLLSLYRHTVYTSTTKLAHSSLLSAMSRINNNK